MSVARLLVVCGLCVAGVIAIVPRAGGRGRRGLGEGPGQSGMFRDVIVPHDTVPVSIGRVIGSGAGIDGKLDAQVKLLGFRVEVL